MEKTDAREYHCHSVLIAALDDKVISDRTARLSDILNAALVRTLNVVREREERIGTQNNILHAVEPCALC